MKRARRVAVVAASMLLTLALSATPADASCHVASFVDDPYQVGEAGGVVTITVSNNGGGPPGGTVDYRTNDDSAKAGQDYTARSGTLSYGLGESEKSFTVPISNDSAHESSEAFTVALSNGTGCFSQLDTPATVTIVDNDPAPVATQTQVTPTKSPTPKATPTTRSTPASTPATSSPTPTPTVTQPSPSPSPTAGFTTVAQPVADEGGLSGGALGGIVAGVVVAGGAAALLVRRRFLTRGS